MRTLVLAALAAAALAAPGALEAQEAPLPLGTFASGEIPYGEGATYVFQAPGPGFLTVVVRGADGQEIALTVSDDENQYLPDGQSDQDVGGRLDAEQMVVAIPRAGTYRVGLESFTGVPSTFQIGASFLATPLAAGPDDPDGRPSGAQELLVGASHEDTVGPEDQDPWDWYRIPVSQTGVLTVLTRGEADVALEWYLPEDFSQAMDYSDQDGDGSLGNESFTLDVSAGDVIFVKVIPLGTEGAAYRIATGIIPG